MRCWKSMPRQSWASKFEIFLLPSTLLKEIKLCSWFHLINSFPGPALEWKRWRRQREWRLRGWRLSWEKLRWWSAPWNARLTKRWVDNINPILEWRQTFCKINVDNIVFVSRRGRTRNWQQSVMSLFPKWGPRISYWQRFVIYNDILISVFQI